MSDFSVTTGTYLFYDYHFDEIINRLRKGYPNPSGYRPALKYMVFGMPETLPEINCEIPQGLEIGLASEEFKEEQEHIFGEYMSEQYNALWTDALKTQNWAVISGDSIEDGGTLNYLVNTAGIIEMFAQMGMAVLDPMTYRLFTSEEWHKKFFLPLKKEYFDPCTYAVIITDKEDDGTVRMRTLGMRKFGRPDIALVNIPDKHYMMPSAIELLNSIMSNQVVGCSVHQDGRFEEYAIYHGETLCGFRGVFDDNMNDDFFKNMHITVDHEKCEHHDNVWIGVLKTEHIADDNFMTAEQKFNEFYEEFVKARPRRTQVTFEPYRGETTLFSSKIGGKPYLPRTMKYPQTAYDDMENVPLIFLAQINFSEFATIAGFPEKGILQFYIDGRESFDYGLPAGNHMEQSSFRVIYHEEILPEREIFSEDELPNLPEDEMMPFMGTFALKFGTIERSDPAIFDYSLDDICVEVYNELFGKDVSSVSGSDNSISEDDKKFWDMMYKNLGEGGSHVGGYPFFAQDDPRRDNEEYAKCDTLLLQIDSNNEIIWGDFGVANFFISHEDLEKRDFRRVLYNWDCC